MEPEVVIAVIAPGLAVLASPIKALLDAPHVRATFEADGHLKGFVHEIETEDFGEQHH